jgi:hypothetical protein
MPVRHTLPIVKVIALKYCCTEQKKEINFLHENCKAKGKIMLIATVQENQGYYATSQHSPYSNPDFPHFSMYTTFKVL